MRRACVEKCLVNSNLIWISSKFGNIAKKCMNISKKLYEKGIIKNRAMLTQTQKDHKFVGRIDNIKTLLAGIKALNFCEHGFVHISEEGMRITVEKGKSVQASLFITNACFHEFHVEGLISFGLNINVIYDCLTIYGSTECSIKMYYKGFGTPLIIIMHPHGVDDVMTEISIKTSNYEDVIDFNLDEETANAVFLRGIDFFNIISEIDKSAEELELILAPTAPFFKINVIGMMQSETSVAISKSSAMMLLFKCNETTRSRYRCIHIKLILKALAVASKVAIKTDPRGLLEMHFMLQSEEDEAEIYIQFYIAPQADID